jgi:HD-like signal output (HDOD) protein
MIIIPPPDEQEVRYRVSQVKDLPLLHGSLPRMLEIFHDEVLSAKELESMVRYDQVLSAKILRIANSSYFGHRGVVGTLSEAIEVIGFDQAKSMCLCNLLTEFFSGEPIVSLEDRRNLWKHGYATARAASELARMRPWVSEEQAYALGLIHDLGWTVMATHFTEYFSSVQNLARSRRMIPWSLESQYRLSHTHIGKWIATKWNLPEVFHRVMEFHHTPERSPAFRPEVRMIYLANLLVNTKDYPELPVDEITLACRGELCITDEEWQACRNRLDEIWFEVDQLWDLLK